MPTREPRRSVMWFRRDLRLTDHPALSEAADAADEVLPLFVVDPVLWDRSGAARLEYLRRSLDSLDRSVNGALVVRVGDATQVVPDLVRSSGAGAVYISADFGPYGARRDVAVEAVLARMHVPLHRIGSPYAVAPGRIRKADGTPYRVYTPYYRAWCAHGWRRPDRPNTSIKWATGIETDKVPSPVWDDSGVPQLPEAGEEAALSRWRHFRDTALGEYASNRDRPDLPGTSRMSVHLRFGEIHPRTLLADLGASDHKLDKPHEVFRKELAWREFYADVLHHNPSSAREYLKPEFAAMHYDTGPTAEQRLRDWQQGRTGYPIVDAGMRQLLHEGWMHNRVRMIVASFLVKDLHLEWQVGAEWFMQNLVDGDVASNAHGWQWVAGCGTDAAPYFRIFNPITQGERFDPDGEYVRRYVAELRHLSGASAHQPWKAGDGYSHGYPRPIIDHGEERKESLARYELIRGLMREGSLPRGSDEQ